MNLTGHSDSICSVLSWDSEFWGLPVARLNNKVLRATTLNESLQWCEAEQIRCLYFLADAKDAETHRLATSAGFRFVGVKMDLTLSLGNWLPHQGNDYKVREATVIDLPRLKEITSGAYLETRFYNDGSFEPRLCEKLYQLWIERDLTQRKVIVVEDESALPLGYLSFKEDYTSVVKASLAAVDRAFRGKGVSKSLFREMIRICKKHSAPSISVSTQASNIAMLRSLEGLGFRTSSANVWYHKWF